MAKIGAQRQRPCFYYGLENLTEVYDNPSEQFVSFYSGDATIAFSTFGTGILLAIARNRFYVKIYSNLGFILAFTGAFLRIVAFMHWTTDVLTGIVTGFLIGFGVPYLIFLKDEDDEDEDVEFKSQEITNPFKH
jgi:membrane-associated phospholipid phosphatase